MGGSSGKTSRAAPPHCPDSRASNSAASSIIPPRATFITLTPFLHFDNVLVDIKSVVIKHFLLNSF